MPSSKASIIRPIGGVQLRYHPGVQAALFILDLPIAGEDVVGRLVRKMRRREAK